MDLLEKIINQQIFDHFLQLIFCQKYDMIEISYENSELAHKKNYDF